MACGNNRFSCIFSVNLHVVKASTKDYNLQKFSICREKLKEVRSGSRRFTGRTDFPADMRRIDMTPRNLANNELLLTFPCRPESPAGHTNPREFSFDPDSWPTLAANSCWELPKRDLDWILLQFWVIFRFDRVVSLTVSRFDLSEVSSLVIGPGILFLFYFIHY